MPAAKYDLNVDRGSTFKVTLDLEDTASDPVDLSNYNAEMQVRRSINDDKMVCRLTTAWPQGCFGPSIAGEFKKGEGVTGYTGGIVLNYQGVTGKILIQIDSKSSYWAFEKPISFYDLRLTNNADNSVTSIIKGEVRSSATLIDTERSPASFAETPTPSATGTTAGVTVSINASVIGFPTPVSTYYWIQNSSVISGATGSSYTPTASGPLLGHITVTNNEGFSGATVDFGTIVAVDGEFAPFFTGTPSASSTDVFTGTQVTIDNVGATGNPAPSTTYQWTQNSSVIIGATSQSYTPSATGPLSGNVTISNSQGSTGATLDFGTVVAGASSEAINVARFAIPSGMVTTASTYTVDYVAENVNPAEYLTSSPTITQSNGVNYNGSKQYLTYPNSIEQGSFVYRANVSLPLGGSTLDLIRNDTDTQSVRITRRSALNTTTVSNDAAFAAALDGAYSGDGVTLDEIYVNYNARMNDVWAAQTLSGADTRFTTRDTYLTIAPTGGNEITWSMNNDVPLNPRTSNHFIRYKNITIGSSADDWTSGNYYNEDYSHILFDGCTFESKYNLTDYGYLKRPNGIRVTILGSSADVNSLVPGEYFYQGEGGQSGHSADTESTNFGYVGYANALNVYEYGTTAGISFASFNVYGTVPFVGVSGSFVAGATVEVAYNPVLNKGNSTAAPRGFTLESYIGVSGDNMPIGDDGRTLITIISPTRKNQVEGFMGFIGCNFINTPGPIMSYSSLVRDCFYNGHRSDICTGVACGINNRAVNTAVRRETNDYYGDQLTHIDLHQWWGTTASHPYQYHENFYYGGHMVEDEAGVTLSSLQHTLFDRSVCCSYNTDIFMRKSICRYKTDEDQNFIQLAGNFSNVGLHEVECVGVPGTPGDGVISYRMAYNDQRPDNGVTLSNFYVNGCTASRFEVTFSSISGLPNIDVRASTVTDISDVSSYLNGLTTEGFGYGITFSNCSVSPAPQYGTFAADTTNEFYRTNSGSGYEFVNTFVDRGTQLAAGITGSGINSFSMYPDKFFIGFDSQAERDAFNTRNPAIGLTMISDSGVTYNYAWNSVGSSPTWGTLSTVLYPDDETTGTTWDSNWTDLYARFGDNPQYDMGESV